ncbi:mastermind-like protein 2, partial [Mustelus asterias]
MIPEQNGYTDRDSLINPRVFLLEKRRLEGGDLTEVFKIMLQGSIKRKLESSGSPANHDKINELSDGAFSSEVKRIYLEDVSLPMGQGDTSSVLRPDVQTSSLIGHRSQALQTPPSMGPSLGCVAPGANAGLMGSNQVNGSDISSQFAVTSSAEMKPTVGDGHNMFSFDSKGVNNMQTMDQDLEDLLEELTNMPNPPLNELDILTNRSDPLNLGLVQTSQSSTRKPSPQGASHLENAIPNREFSPSYNQAPGGSPQRRPPSTGTSYPLPAPPNPMPLPMSSASQNQAPSQAQPPLLTGTSANRVGTNWHELSHAQQLKKIAASQHQRSVSQQPHPQQGQATNWPPVPSSGPSPPYRPDKLPSPSLHQQPFSPPSAMLANIPPSGNAMQSYLYSKAPSSQPNRLPMMVQQQAQQQQQQAGLSQAAVNENSIPSEQLSFSNTKPLSHFDPDLSAQKMPQVAGSQSQPSVVHYMQQPNSAVQQPPQPGPTQQPSSLQLQFRNKLRMQQMRLQNTLQQSP